MKHTYQTFATVKFRPGLNHDPEIRKLSFTNAGPLAFVYQDTDEMNEVDQCGLGYPVKDAEGATINFLKMNLDGHLFSRDSLIEESLLPGHPVCNGRVMFGRRTKVILITLDCHTASVLNRATELGSIAVLYMANVRPICTELLSKYPGCVLKVCLNGDHEDENSHSHHEAQVAVNDLNVEVYASGLRTYREMYLKEGAEAVRKALEDQQARKTWDFPRNNKDLNILTTAFPWPQRFNGEVLVRNLTFQIQRHVSVSANQALLIGLWILHTYLLDSSKFTPVLAIDSAERETGKSTLLAVLHLLCRGAYRTAQITPGQLMAIGDGGRNTILLDDGDTAFGSQAFVNLFVNSHDRGTGGITTATKTKLILKKPFFAKATKSHVGIPDALAFRAVHIHLQRKRPDEELGKVPERSFDSNDEFVVLRSQMVRWCQDHAAAIADMATLEIDLGSYMVSSTYSPLFTIAKCISDTTLERSIKAAKENLADTVAKSDRVQMLDNIRELLHNFTDRNISSSELVAKLCERSDWLWATCKKGRPLNQVSLADALKQVGISTHAVWIDGSTKRGFCVSDFDEAFARYLSPLVDAAVDPLDSPI